MAVTEGDVRLFRAVASWRTPLVIVACGCVIALLSFGPRSSLGFFIQPMSREFSWGRDVFGLALALQNLLWGLGQPVAGAIADRFGVLRVMCIGAILYASGLLMMRYAATPLSLDLAAGAARSGAWFRHRGRLIRSVPVRAVRRGVDRQFRLANGVAGIRSSDAADRSTLARACHPGRDNEKRAGCRPAVIQDGF